MWESIINGSVSLSKHEGMSSRTQLRELALKKEKGSHSVVVMKKERINAGKNLRRFKWNTINMCTFIPQQL